LYRKWPIALHVWVDKLENTKLDNSWAYLQNVA
jgi:hypothetical protein